MVASQREIEILHRLKREKLGVCRIARIVGRSSGSVSYLLRKAELLGRRKRVKPRRNTLKIDNRRGIIDKLAKKQRKNGSKVFDTATSIRLELHRAHQIVVSNNTVKRDLKQLGFVCRVRPKTCLIDADPARRVLYCKGVRSGDRVVFSDEKIFTSNDHSNRTEWIPRGGVASRRAFVRWPTGRVMVWAAIGVGFRHLVIIPENTKMTSEEYKRRCLQGKLVNHLLESRSMFMQDGAGCHKGCREYLRSKGVNLIEDFPARSPDLNPIETLWAIMQKRVSTHVARDRTELIAGINKTWDELDVGLIDKLVKSFHSRATTCIGNKGFM